MKRGDLVRHAVRHSGALDNRNDESNAHVMICTRHSLGLDLLVQSEYICDVINSEVLDRTEQPVASADKHAEAAEHGAKHARIQARVSARQRELLQRAADLEGRSLSEFVVDSAQRHAEEVIRNHNVIKLSVRDTEAFMEALINPPAPSARLRAAAERYKREVVER